VSEKTIDSQTRISDVLAAPENTVWVYRDAEVMFEFYDDAGLVIYRYSKNGDLLWDAGVMLLSKTERVIDLLRAARANHLEEPYGDWKNRTRS
jgi:hypothetical protein